MTDIVERLRTPENGANVEMANRKCAEAATEIERLRNAVWAAIPWLDDLKEMGTLVDQEQRSQTAAILAAAVGRSANEQEATASLPSA